MNRVSTSELNEAGEGHIECVPTLDKQSLLSTVDQKIT